jgi:hypothetical protein
MEASFGTVTALLPFVNTILMFLDTLPEPGRLALVGVGLIAGALILRKIFSRFQPVLDAAPKADAQAK